VNKKGKKKYWKGRFFGAFFCAIREYTNKGKESHKATFPEKGMRRVADRITKWGTMATGIWVAPPPMTSMRNCAAAHCGNIPSARTISIFWIFVIFFDLH
jgi:hypothetical protein